MFAEDFRRKRRQVDDIIIIHTFNDGHVNPNDNDISLSVNPEIAVSGLPSQPPSSQEIYSRASHSMTLLQQNVPILQSEAPFGQCVSREPITTSKNE